MAKLYKVWIEIEAYDETGESVDGCDLSFALPFSASATCLTTWDAVRKAQEMHAAINPGFEVDEAAIARVRAADEYINRVLAQARGDINNGQ